MVGKLTIHATPRLGQLPASDVESLYLVSVLQSQAAGEYEVTTGDWGSNGGQLPFVTSSGSQAALDRSLGLPGVSDPDEHLSQEDKAEALSWVAYIEGKVTDLVNHSLYSLPPNYPATVGKAHLSNLRFPYTLYIPQRLRAIHKARLQHVGLWGLGGMHNADLADEDRKRLEQVYVQAPGGTVAPRAWSGWRAGREFEERRRKRTEEELVKIAKSVFDVVERRLAAKTYFFGDKPTTPDLKLFANLSLLLDIDMPNTLLPTLLQSHHPNIIAHHTNLLSALFGPTGWPLVSLSPVPTQLPQPRQTSWWETIASYSPFASSTADKCPSEQTEDEKRMKQRLTKMERGRWIWIAGSAAAMVTYVFASGLVQLTFSAPSQGEEEEEEEQVWDIVGPEGEDLEEEEVFEEDE